VAIFSFGEGPPVEKKHGILDDLGVVEHGAGKLSILLKLFDGIGSFGEVGTHEAEVGRLGVALHGGEVGGLLVDHLNESVTLLGDDSLSEGSTSFLKFGALLSSCSCPFTAHTGSRSRSAGFSRLGGGCSRDEANGGFESVNKGFKFVYHS
jgi:hypothetical protein